MPRLLGARVHPSARHARRVAQRADGRRRQAGGQNLAWEDPGPQARWIVKERQDMLAEARREAEQIIKHAHELQAGRTCRRPTRSLTRSRSISRNSPSPLSGAAAARRGKARRTRADELRRCRSGGFRSTWGTGKNRVTRYKRGSLRRAFQGPDARLGPSA